MIQVPDLTGKTLDEAQKQVGDDFDVVRHGAEDGNNPENTILEQDPSDGQAEKGSEIRATVASGQNEVPSVEGRTQQEAESALSEAGFEPTVKESESDADRQGQVISQSPGGGGKGDVGSKVEITVGIGPSLVEVPNLYGSTPDQAAEILKNSELKLGAQDSANSPDVAAGGIIAQSTAPGESVEAGTEIGVTVSDGPEKLQIPDVTGQDLTTAQQNMWNAGFAYTPVEIQSNEPAGTVISTDPAGGTMLDPWADKVTINYSAGPPPEPQPEPTTTPQPDASSGQNNQKAQEKAREARQEAQKKAREATRKARQEVNEN